MGALCGIDCSNCGLKTKCKGCEETCGQPFGGKCIAAEYIKVGGKEAFEAFKKQIILEFNSLGIEGLPEIKELYCLAGFYVNLEYPLPGGNAKFLNDNCIYLGAQVESTFAKEEGEGQCFGLIAGMDFLLVCTYGEGGSNPELIRYQRR